MQIIHDPHQPPVCCNWILFSFVYTDDYVNEIHMQITNIFRTIRYSICLTQPPAITETKQWRHGAIMYIWWGCFCRILINVRRLCESMQLFLAFFPSQRWCILSSLSSTFYLLFWETALMFICCLLVLCYHDNSMRHPYVCMDTLFLFFSSSCRIAKQHKNLMNYHFYN